MNKPVLPARYAGMRLLVTSIFGLPTQTMQQFLPYDPGRRFLLLWSHDPQWSSNALRVAFQEGPTNKSPLTDAMFNIGFPLMLVPGAFTFALNFWHSPINPVTMIANGAPMTEPLFAMTG